MQCITHRFVTKDILTNFEISSPGIFTPVTSTMKPAVLIARIRRIVIYPVDSAIVANFSRGGN